MKKLILPLLLLMLSFALYAGSESASTQISGIKYGADNTPTATIELVDKNLSSVAGSTIQLTTGKTISVFDWSISSNIYGRELSISFEATPLTFKSNGTTYKIPYIITYTPASKTYIGYSLLPAALTPTGSSTAYSFSDAHTTSTKDVTVSNKKVGCS